MLRPTRQLLGRMITADAVEAPISRIKFMPRDHTASNEILGYQVPFYPAGNSPEEIRPGGIARGEIYMRKAPRERPMALGKNRLRPAESRAGR